LFSGVGDACYEEHEEEADFISFVSCCTEEGIGFEVFICMSLNLHVRFYQSCIVGFELKMLKLKCNFTDNLKAEFPFFKRRKTDTLPVDIDDFVNKIFQYFHVYTVRVEESKEFCTFVDAEYKPILGSVKTT
jgi:hypothetical protein